MQLLQFHKIYNNSLSLSQLLWNHDRIGVRINTFSSVCNLKQKLANGFTQWNDCFFLTRNTVLANLIQLYK